MKLFISILFCFMLSCQSTTVKNNNGNTIELATGWLDADTYTVKVVGENEDDAIDKAKHKILKTIVNVRMVNQSRYTDITKIKGEFKVSLEKGKVIKKTNVQNGLEIYFQIYGKGLKQKFERK